jgi:hypothetical protein
MIAMFQTDEELNAREELLENLRTLFRYEATLLADGWYSEAEFQQAVIDAISDYLDRTS